MIELIVFEVFGIEVAICRDHIQNHERAAVSNKMVCDLSHVYINCIYFMLVTL